MLMYGPLIRQRAPVSASNMKYPEDPRKDLTAPKLAELRTRYYQNRTGTKRKTTSASQNPNPAKKGRPNEPQRGRPEPIQCRTEMTGYHWEDRFNIHTFKAPERIIQDNAPNSQPVRSDRIIQCADLSPSHNLAVAYHAASDENTSYIHVEDKKADSTAPPHLIKGTVQCMSFGSERYLFFANNHEICVMDRDDAKYYVIGQHASPVEHVSVVCKRQEDRVDRKEVIYDQFTIVSASARTVCVWNINSASIREKTLMESWRGWIKPLFGIRFLMAKRKMDLIVKSVSVHPYEPFALVGLTHGRAYCFKTNTETITLHEIPGIPKEAITGLAFNTHKDKPQVAIATFDGMIQIHSYKSDTFKFELKQQIQCPDKKYVDDIVFFGSKLFALGKQCQLFMYDSSSTPTCKIISPFTLPELPLEDNLQEAATREGPRGTSNDSNAKACKAAKENDRASIRKFCSERQDRSTSYVDPNLKQKLETQKSQHAGKKILDARCNDEKGNVYRKGPRVWVRGGGDVLILQTMHGTLVKGSRSPGMRVHTLQSTQNDPQCKPYAFSTDMQHYFPPKSQICIKLYSFYHCQVCKEWTYIMDMKHIKQGEDNGFCKVCAMIKDNTEHESSKKAYSDPLHIPLELMRAKGFPETVYQLQWRV